MKRTIMTGVALVSLLTACKKPVPPPLYLALPVGRRDITVSALASGAVEAITVVSVKSRASGTILRMPAETGRKVHRGATFPADVIVERLEGFQGPIVLQMAAQQSYQVQGIRGDDVTVIDLGTRKVVDDIKVGKHVHGLAIQADGRRLFATVETEHTLKFIDTGSDKVTASVPLTGKPNECAVTPDGKYVVVPIRDGNSVDIVDVAQQKIVKILPIHVPHNAFDAGSNRFIFVSSMDDHEIDVIDLAKMEYSAHIPVGGRPRPYVVVPDEQKMYVAVSYLHGFEVVDIRSQRPTRGAEPTK